jgi:hypothetical protein
MVASLRSKWVVGKAVRAGLAVGGRIPHHSYAGGETTNAGSMKMVRDVTDEPPTHFQRHPPGRGQLAVFSALLARPVSIQIWALRSRLEKQPTDLQRRHHYMRDGTLGPNYDCRHAIRQLLVS